MCSAIPLQRLMKLAELIFLLHKSLTEFCSFIIHHQCLSCTAMSALSTCRPAGVTCVRKHDCVRLCVQVLGCAKGVLATVVSVLLFRNPVTVLGGVGYFMTVFGVFAYTWTKSNTLKQ